MCFSENGANQETSFVARHPPPEEQRHQPHCGGSLKSCAVKDKGSVWKKTLSVSVPRIMKLFLWPPITRRAMTRINGSVQFKLYATAALSLEIPWKGSGVGSGAGADVVTAILHICKSKNSLMW